MSDHCDVSVLGTEESDRRRLGPRQGFCPSLLWPKGLCIPSFIHLANEYLPGPGLHSVLGTWIETDPGATWDLTVSWLGGISKLEVYKVAGRVLGTRSGMLQNVASMKGP